MNPLALSAQAVADATGKVTVRLPAPSLGTWWQAAVVVPTAPTGATLALYLAGSKELSWIGPQPSATVVILPSQVIQVEGSGFTAGQIVSVNVRGGWSPGNAQGIAPAGPSSFTANTLTGKVTAKITGPVSLAAGSSVDISSGTVDLGAGASVAISAGQLTSTTIPLQAVATQMLVTTFGTGATGTVTISSTATLSQVANYKTLTVDATLTAPWEVFCSVALVGTGAVANNGGNATASSTGAPAPGGTFYGGGAFTTIAADFTGGAGGSGKAGGTLHTGGKAGTPLRGTLLFQKLLTYTLSGGGKGAGKYNTTPKLPEDSGGGAGVVMVAAKRIAGSVSIQANGGNGVRTTATNYGGGGGAGIVLVYSHTTNTWTGKAETLAGTTVTEPTASGGGGSKIVRHKFVGAIFK